MIVTISLAQMIVHTGDVAANLITGREMIAAAAARGSDLVVLPELWSTGYDLARAREYATAVDDGVFAEMAILASQHEMAIVGSLLACDAAGQVRNTALYIGADGRPRGAYDKIHLFGPMAEKQYLAEGSDLMLVDTGWATAGLAICYDLRFPEMFRAYALAGAEAVILCAEWPRPRLEHWRTLLRARAIENQMPLIACNRVGCSGETEFFGHSTIVDACGETVLEGGAQEDLLTATLDMAHVAEVRDSMPVFADRRPDTYRQTGGRAA